ncbi:uncharacterized protein LOC113306045 [Papaver somniferum]|uniref:uncharacterized protein LOC113306045 n=1 Tax=Papaver somniferum TaxID=3469 RepID=UPI000E7045D7|nr:uncharacterized protein LOC113306045 [Papaver somniferum]
MVIHNSTSNKKGNIWLFCNKNLPTSTVVSMSSQMITVIIRENLVSGVHAHVGVVQRRFLWSEMEAISDLQLPCLAIGDFNAITTSMEKVGGKPANTRNMLEFNTCLEKCELHQSPKSGLDYSWSHCQHGARRILCNLDRAVFNNLWIQKHGVRSYKVGMRIASDHSPLLGGCVTCPKPKNSKLKKLKKVLVDWNWRVFGNVNVQIKEAEKEVQDAMKESDANPLNEEFLEKLVQAENNLNSKEVQLSTMMKLKARTKWVKEGSANTSFFHTKLKVDISESLIGVIPKSITEEDQAMLDAIPSSEKIKKIIFEMDPDSSPGPDGFSGGLNSNFLVLLSKIESARSPQHFRPIGLSSVSFKIFTKIITTRMSYLMNKLISPHQDAYIKGRNIQDQIVLASEMINEMKKKRRGGNIGLKLDISQAYDSVRWKFLFQVLIKYGFSVTWFQWLSTLFESAKVSVMTNGGPNGFFSVGRGLRQGDPLSPILFVLMEDVLSRNISKSLAEGNITPMVIRNGIHPSHMFFADDMFIFCNGAKKSIQNLMKILEEYQKISGQVIDKSKSKLFVDGITDARTMQIKELMQIEVSSLPDRYLGVILQAGRVKISTMLANGGDLAKETGYLESDSPIIEYVGYSDYVKSHINMKVSDLIKEGKWNLSGQIKLILSDYTLPEIGIGNDNIIWKGGIKVELAVEWHIQDIIINLDSKTMVNEFAENRMPWFVKMRWNKAIAKIHSIQFRHSFRETNLSADAAAKKRSSTGSGSKINLLWKTMFLSRIELPDIAYYRMC